MLGAKIKLRVKMAKMGTLVLNHFLFRHTR
jgi:hypothetical protein